MKRLTTRSVATATAIRDREPFTTSGSLRGGRVTPVPYLGMGCQLSGVDLAWWRHDLDHIRYVVWSYSTPIAWWSERYGWHRVGQSFSPTTGKHQGNLYLIDKPDHAVTYTRLPSWRPGEPGSDKWQVNCATCGIQVSRHVYKKDAVSAAHTHRIAGRVGLVPV